MKVVEDLNQEGGTVFCDDTFFKNCKFSGCSLIYAGGEVVWKDTTFVGCEFIFAGAAKNTVEFTKNFGWGPKETVIHRV